MFSISTAPAKQSVTETISVLSGRLGSATLLEDRRAAILGLRSFAKEFPATVASGALRSLIGGLGKDGEDVDTVKVILETLLMLFNPNDDSPEASDEVMLWMADEFTQRQDNITLLLDFLDSTDFYPRLYSLQLLTAILSARTERTEECIFTAPLGISRLVAVLDDQRDAIRNEGIVLLTFLTSTSTDVQKLVAFENAFDRLFAIMASDGALSHGGRTTEDCLIFLANLLRRNTSNQSLFRESGGILRLAAFLEAALRAQEEEGDDVASWAQVQRNRNIYALLGVVRLLLAEGAVGLSQNQTALGQHGLLYHALQLSFSRAAQTPIKAEALVTCADIIRGNTGLQESFAQFQVPAPLAHKAPGTEAYDAEANGDGANVYVIDGLLDLTLTSSSTETFDVRRGACECIMAYFFKHSEIRLHFLRRAIEGYRSSVDETANVLAVLLRPETEDLVSNPYRIWFAAIITFHLLFDNPEAKSLAMEVTEGDAENGEEVVTSIQTITAHAVSGLNREQDSRVVIGYLILLLGWMFEDFDAVDDFLDQGSNVQSLIEAVVRQSQVDDIVQGLSAMLLGVVYEFSTKDSPIPRPSLHSILLSRMGRERYFDTLSKLRSHPFMRDFEVLPQKLDASASASGRLPDVFFDALFVNFFKDNYSRILRAIDRDPGVEVSVVANGVQKGISRQLVDSLRQQLEEKESAVQEAQVALATLERQLEQEQADHKKSREVAAMDVSKAKAEVEALRRDRAVELEAERRKLSSSQEDHKRQLDYVRKSGEAEAEKLRRKNAAAEADFKKQLEQAKQASEIEVQRTRQRADAEIADLRATISRLESTKEKSQELQALREEHSVKLAEQKEQHALDLEKQMKLTTEAENRASKLETELKGAQEKMRKRDITLKEAQEAKQATQTELDDLLMVFSDLEDKVAQYKARLEKLGEQVSDGEEDESEDETEEGDGAANAS
ncbi:hypothetical protein SODALDRAFT_336736 [Sodiomyces alkalinus F11]|uniref:Intracellular protein transport protein n=1 Tax=Sodiomyces alkalinus (strain CBS 110278 / VKM F-3762 / F11) TaxID=1314773 RepID=A0A3N2Q9N6_SODAK|nr:hypothetical protein SODALDRAFT_336736 [Sodiomyces alkalinus F11]ROT43355.1 hypothetical protein SODALDRAFT_336736 [Sodiomyces alkalinus F11]